MIREFCYAEFVKIPVVTFDALKTFDLDTPFLLEGNMAVQRDFIASMGVNDSYNEMMRKIMAAPQQIHKKAGTPKTRNWVSVEYWTIACGKKTGTRHCKAHIGRLIPDPLPEEKLIDTSFLPGMDGILKITEA